MADLLSLADAQARVLARVEPLGTEAVAVGEVAGRFLARDALAAVDLPPFPSSAMDGFALRASDTPGRLPVVARIAAGVPAPRPLRDGEAMAIATGGVVPEGADVVVPIEYVVENDNSVEIKEAVVQNAHIRPRGGDVRVGDVIVERGTRITPAHIGALAAAGVERVSCGRHPRVAVLSTGTELRRPGERLRPGQVYEANGAMLASALAASGALVAALPSVPDDEASHRDALERALANDVVVTSGGVSVGPHDLVRRVLGGLGVREEFWGVAVKPGKPVSFGTFDQSSAGIADKARRSRVRSTRVALSPCPFGVTSNATSSSAYGARCGMTACRWSRSAGRSRT